MEGKNDKVKELWGRKFRIVKNGLDEAEVFSFVSSLTDQHSDLTKKLEHLDSLVSSLTDQYNDLAKKLEHLDSLTKLAERTVIEVDNDKLEHLDSLTKLAERTVIESEKQAKSFNMEIEEQANATATAIITEAEQRAKGEADRIIAEAERKAEESAKEKAEAIKALAEEEATRIIAEAKQKAEDLVKERTAAAEEVAQSILREAKEKTEEGELIIKQEAEQLLIRSKKIAEGEIKEMFEKAYQRLLSNLEGTQETTAISIKEESIALEPSELEAAAYGAIQMISEEPQEQPPLRQEGAEEESLALYEGTVELAIPPPIGLDRMLQLHKHLKQTPQIEVLNLGGSVDKGITIRLLLHTPLPLLNILGDLHEVEKASDELQEAEKIVPARQTEEETPVRRIVVTTKK